MMLKKLPDIKNYVIKKSFLNMSHTYLTIYITICKKIIVVIEVTYNSFIEQNKCVF